MRTIAPKREDLGSWGRRETGGTPGSRGGPGPEHRVQGRIGQWDGAAFGVRLLLAIGKSAVTCQ